MSLANPKEPLLATPEKKLSFFQIFIQKATPSEKRIIIFICSLFSMSSTMILGIPIVFKDPKFICLPQNTECIEEVACETGDFYIDMVTGPKSFSAEYELVCDKKSMKTFAITLSFVGIFVGCLMSTFILVQPKNRKTFLSFFGLLLSASSWGMIFFQSSFFTISLLIALSTFSFMYINTFSYLFIGENFKGELAGFVTIMYSVTWAFTGIFWAIFAFLINADWRIFVVFSGIVSALGAIGLFMSKNENNYENKVEVEENVEGNTGFFSYFHDLWPNIQIRKNFLVYAFFWALFTTVYSVILVELESVGGNLFVNMVFCSTLEVIAAILAGGLTKTYNCTDILRYLLTFLSIFFTIFVFCPPYLTTGSTSQVLFFLVCLLIAKVNNDTLNLVTYLYLPKVFTDKYVGFWMLSSRFLSRFMGLFIPSISYLVRSFGFHPFFFYGLCWIFCRVTFNFTKEVQFEGVDDLLNDMNVNMTERLSVMAGSFSNGIVVHDDNLKHIKVDGVPLSIIRRFKNNPNSIKGGSEIMKLRESVLKRSMVNMGDKKVSLYELKENINFGNEKA